MKKINLIGWLSRNSHEKQSPQRFARYAVMLIMLLTLGVGQMWADVTYRTIYTIPQLLLNGKTGWTTDGNAYYNHQYGENNWSNGTMTKTSDTYHGYTVYSASLPDEYGGLKYLEINSGGDGHWGDDNYAYKWSPDGYWSDKSNWESKIYIGYYNDAHTWKDDGFDANTSTTVYYVKSTDKTVKLNRKFSNLWDLWQQTTMTNTSKTYNGTPIYSATFTDQREASLYLQFQLYDGGTYDSQEEVISNSWTTNSTYAGKMYANSSWNTLAYDVTLDRQSGATGSTSIVATCGSAMPSATMPTRDGYTFAGYYTGTGGSGTKYYNADGTSAATWPSDGTGPTTLYANWTAITISATVTPTAGATGASKNFTFTITSNVPTSSGYYVGVYNFGGVNAGNHGAGEMNGVIAYNSNPTEYSKNDVGGFSTAGTYTTHAFVMKESVVQATSADITYTAGDYYSVTFDLQGHGSAIDEQDIASGSKATKPDDPSATGYDFGGWFKEAGCSNEWDFDEETVTANTILYAKWTGKDYDVILDANGGSSDQTVTARYGSGMPSILKAGGAIVAPTRAGYIFQGYFANNDGTGTQYYTSALASNHNWDVATADQHIYAHWINAPTVTTPTVSRSTIDVDGTTPLTISATSTYLANPVVIFTISDGTNSYKLTASTGAIGSGPTYSTVHKATFTPPTPGTWMVTAATLYEGKLIDNMGTNSVYWETAGSGGSYSKGLNPYAQAGAKYAKDSVVQIGRAASGDNWGGALTKKASGTEYDYSGWGYVHTMQYRTADGATRLKVNNSCGGDIATSTVLSTNTWQEVMYNIGSCDVKFAFIQPSYDNTTAYTVYVDDIILLKESSLASAQKATVASSVAITAYQMYTVTLTSATEASVSAGQATGVSITASVASEGKKFDHWEVTGGASVASSTSRITTVTATAAGTATAVYTDRTKRKIYFKAPGDDWNPPYAYLWDADGPADDYNAAYPGVAMSTETVDCVEYYYYEYIVDDNGEGDDLSARLDWDKVIFNKGSGDHEYPESGWDKTRALNVENGHFYFYHCAAGSTGSAYGTDWYLQGNFNTSDKWNSWEYPIDITCATNTGYIDMASLSSSNTQYFHVYQITTDKKFRITSSTSDAEVTMSTEYTLHNQSSGADYFTPAETTDYRFTLNVETPSAPVLTVRPASDENHTVTLAVSGQGSITTPGTGTQTIHRYTTTTITAVEDAGYRFTGWTVTGTNASNVSIANTSSKTTTITAHTTTEGVTVTANFSNENIIYFDRSAVNGVWSGSDVYVTFFTNDNHWVEYYEGEVRKERVKMQNWVAGLMSQKMDRIPNSNIYYLYTGGNATQWYMFTDKNMVNGGETWEQAAVARGDFNSGSGCNLFVVENYVEKTVAKTGYYYGYWMKYHEEDPGVQLCIYSSGSSAHISGSPFTLTTDEIGSTEFTKSVHLSAATTYAIELKGLNGIYYKNRGTMTSKGSSGWEYVEREATRGHITTTAEGDYKFTLSCANQLILSAEYPLDVNDFQIVFNGKVKTTDGSNKIHPSRVIRHLTEAGTQKDTISFFVIKGNDWSLQIQKCKQVNPTIIWENVGSAFSPATFGDPATGVYNFVVEQTHNGSSNSVSINTKVEKYDGHFYIRSDAAKGGWEGYKKALDNQMIYSNFSRLHSDFDYYHCSYRYSGNNVKFTIANDYSSCVSDTTENDAYVTSYGNLPADASVRFMWNSETNVLSRAYLNGSHTTDFLLLEAKGDSLKNFDDSAIAEAGTVGSIKFKDMGNWIYQKEVQALPGTRVRLTSNYRFGSPESSHIQYFKGESGDWSETGANTEQIIGGTTTGWEKLRLVYDFKTNHLTSAWLPPTDPIDEAKSINADMLLIRRGQNAAQQLTFGVDGKIANVKTIVGAMEFVKDSIVGRVSHFNGDVIGAGGNRANRELMHYISFPFDVAVNDIYGFGQLNKEWYLQYYDGADRARKGFFRGDGTTTFWKFMTLSDTLRANVGYSLLLDNDYFNTDGEGSVWHNTISDSIYLYFPSLKELHKDSIIKSGTKTIRVPEHKHTSGRTFEVESRTLCHDFTDSDWNMMGVPLFQNQTGLDAYFDATADPSDWPGDGKGYFYEWDSIDNNFEIHTAAGYTFKSMHGYMVQYSGEVSFTGASIQPASSVVARRAQKSRENYTMELQLLKENKRVSRTYIELREEACDTFALDEDVYMVYTSHPADLYTYAGNYDVSANVLSMDNHSIPVGIEVHKAGSYTFSMPSSFNGAAILIDTQTGARTNLALSDYIVTLPKGICDGRFYIEIDLNKMPTAIDGVEGGSLKDGKAHKFIENGAMYILQDGKIYDARGNRLQ